MITLKPILPSRRIPPTHILREVLDAASADEAADVVLDLEAPTGTWKRNVKAHITVKSDGIGRTVEMRDKVYGYVDKGTRPHIIRAKQSRSSRGRFGPRGKMRFRPGGTAKTSPGSLRAGTGSKGGKEVFARVVHHPGTKARGFSEIAAKLSRERYRRRIQEALDRVLPEA